jgi:hypothetical protein
VRFHVFSSPLYFLPARESADTDQNARSDSESERTLTLVLILTQSNDVKHQEIQKAAIRLL